MSCEGRDAKSVVLARMLATAALKSKLAEATATARFALSKAAPVSRSPATKAKPTRAKPRMGVKASTAMRARTEKDELKRHKAVLKCENCMPLSAGLPRPEIRQAAGTRILPRQGKRLFG